MSGFLVLLCFFGVLCSLGFLGHRLWLSQRPASWPKDLVRLVLSEVPLSIWKPLPLKGKPDEVYLNRMGELVAVDTKTRARPRVFLSDRIQLSVYRVILGAVQHPKLPQGWRQVASYGYVRLVVNGVEIWRRVPLFSLDDVACLVARKAALDAGQRSPRGPVHSGVCRSCVYWRGCFQRRRTH